MNWKKLLLIGAALGMINSAAYAARNNVYPIDRMIRAVELYEFKNKQKKKEIKKEVPSVREVPLIEQKKEKKISLEKALNKIFPKVGAFQLYFADECNDSGCSFHMNDSTYTTRNAATWPGLINLFQLDKVNKEKRPILKEEIRKTIANYTSQIGCTLEKDKIDVIFNPNGTVFDVVYRRDIDGVNKKCKENYGAPIVASQNHAKGVYKKGHIYLWGRNKKQRKEGKEPYKIHFSADFMKKVLPGMLEEIKEKANIPEEQIEIPEEIKEEKKPKKPRNYSLNVKGEITPYGIIGSNKISLIDDTGAILGIKEDISGFGLDVNIPYLKFTFGKEKGFQLGLGFDYNYETIERKHSNPDNKKIIYDVDEHILNIKPLAGYRVLSGDGYYLDIGGIVPIEYTTSNIDGRVEETGVKRKIDSNLVRAGIGAYLNGRLKKGIFQGEVNLEGFGKFGKEKINSLTDFSNLGVSSQRIKETKSRNVGGINLDIEGLFGKGLVYGGLGISTELTNEYKGFNVMPELRISTKARDYTIFFDYGYGNKKHNIGGGIQYRW